MNNFFTIDESGRIWDLPECECCGAPILREGLCGTCAEWFNSVDKVTQVSVRVVVPDAVMVNPEDRL